MEELILKTNQANNRGPPHLENKEDRGNTWDSHPAEPDLSGIVEPQPGGDHHEKTATAEVCPI